MPTANKMDWAKLLSDVLTEPGTMHEAYSRFRGYSIGNRLWAMMQCLGRGITPGPLASFNRWKELGRNVKKGEKAISLWMPVTCKRKTTDENDTESDATYQLFVIKNHWFVLSQTDGHEYTPEPLPDWNETQALEVLAIKKEPFEAMNGNAQGYAAPGRTVSVSPLAVNPFKTLFHELGHVLLGHIESGALTDTDDTPRNVMEVEAESVAMLCCASLGLPGVEYSRGCIQSWAQGEPISEKSAQRIFAAADKILKAGSGLRAADGT
jgi:antirestriction protein ArdC